MPLLKGKSSKSTPSAVMQYVTNPEKAAYVSVRNLFEDEDYAEQFTETMRRFNKGKKYDERKYYHFKLSCDRKDNVSPEEAHRFAEELTSRLFPDCECVIATHTDTQTVHSHIVVNALNPLTGKKLRISRNDYTAMKDETNRLGAEMGFSEIDFRKRSEHKRTAEERHIILKGGTSWKEELREVIEEAKQQATTEQEFISHLALYGVTLTRSKTEYSYLHPKKQKAIRGRKLGENYTKTEVLNVINTNRHRTNGYADSRIGEAFERISGYDGQSTAPRSIGEIEREMQRLDRTAEYAHRGLDGDSAGDQERCGNAHLPTDRLHGEADGGNTQDLGGGEEDTLGRGQHGKERSFEHVL